MLIKDLIAYLLLYAYTASFGSAALRALCSLANNAYGPDPKRSSQSPTRPSTRHIITDDDGDAFTNDRFYYDERSWEEEGVDRR
jgi:hypothetical protein